MLGVGQRLEFFIRGHHVLEPVVLSDFAFIISEGLGEEIRAVEVEIGTQAFPAEGVDLAGVVPRNMAVAQVFAHDRLILGFRQAIIVLCRGQYRWVEPYRVT